MSDQPNPGQPRELNLRKMAEQFMAGLQRHFDMLAFNLASRESVTEAAYNERARSPRLMPVPSYHHNFEQMQAYARDLLCRQVVNDALNLSASCMNNLHLFLTLVKANKEHGGTGGSVPAEGQQQAQRAQNEFLQARLDRKFNTLEEEYGIMCGLEDTIMSLGFALQAMAQHGGTVQKAHLDKQGRLEIELKTAKSGTAPGELWKQKAELETHPKVFQEGEKIALSDIELQNILLTVGVFAHQLFTAVTKYAQQNRPNG